ncbi:FtsJ methyltransferase domain-containing protein 2 [Chytriomyces hyalinus]|nr:FtsJ methyltransferase domain-containing protein 2 [Chytriomyces hyalinus]
MSFIYQQDPKYHQTSANSPIPPPRLETPAVFNSRSRGRGRGRGRFNERDSQPRDYRDNRSGGGRDGWDNKDGRDARDSRHYDERRDRRNDQRNHPYSREPPRSHPQASPQTQTQAQPISQLSQLPSLQKQQKPDWISAASTILPQSLLSVDVRRAKLPDYDVFCYSHVINGKLNPSRFAVAALDHHALANARSAANPYALVDNLTQELFINRAAVKLANLDHICDGRLSKLLTGGNAHFADLCSGPGGFSEYLLWRLAKTHNVHASAGAVTAYGITLRGELDFNASLVAKGGIIPFYGNDQTGDLTRLENLDAFASFVLERAGSNGIPLVTADGAFSCAGDELYQEDQMKLVLLSEVLCMFKILRHGGDFVVKTFELLTPFSVGLVHLLYKSFKRVAIIKPVSSRPANSERYIVCQELQLSSTKELVAHLSEALSTLANVRQQPAAAHVAQTSSHTANPPGFMSLDERVALGLLDVVSVVDVDEVVKDEAFMDWIKESNTKLSMKQSDALKKMETVAKSGEGGFSSADQKAVAAGCLKEWGLQ